MLNNQVFIPFDVTSLSILRKDHRGIPTGNQNYIYARFTFTPDWDGLNKTAVFSKKGIEPQNNMIFDGLCQVPNEFMETVGDLEVSVFAGDRRTVNSATIEIIQSGFVEAAPTLPPAPSSMYVQTPDSTVPYIGYDGAFWFEADGKLKRIEAADIDPEIIQRISALESGLNALQAESTAKWVLLNTLDNQIRSFEARISALEARI